MKKLALLFAMAVIIISCGNDDDAQPEVLGCTDATSINYNPSATIDDGSCVYNKNITFNFSQNWDGQSVSVADFNNTLYTNEFGNKLNISKLRYLISRISLKRADGTTVDFEEYNLIDVEDSTTVFLAPAMMATTGDYTGISFIYGFNEEDNISGEYPDLNAANWNWPDMLGGGYHFLQMEGSYDDVNNMPQPYAYHNGTARVSEGVFEQTYITFNFNQNFTITEDANIEIKMNIAEWYKNPYTWDLNDLDTDLMMNYEAQMHMYENGPTVFSIGSITQ
ncbi:hypothetical protein QRD02_00760 [Aequorivita sp. SDUM287046]|uniref:Copper-binding protein MbnP-like domain-containing protein n=1 Tax=Aequorivita aurantiaca TaxID=3053356 RepID=A0ABT8DCP2_9FLAO|nr:MbnP family protein [Aequorivita aurantiaca]MDN3722897.1 hypothetical protein [Aequorivita aurantiaca]